MFNQLFFRSDALTRQLSAPLVDERRQYLAECASQGMSRTTLRAKSLLLLSIVEHLRLGHRPKDRISLAEIKDAARRWSRRNLPSANSRYVEGSFRHQLLLSGPSQSPSSEGDLWGPLEEHEHDILRPQKRQP